MQDLDRKLYTTEISGPTIVAPIGRLDVEPIPIRRRGKLMGKRIMLHPYPVCSCSGIDIEAAFTNLASAHISYPKSVYDDKHNVHTASIASTAAEPIQNLRSDLDPDCSTLTNQILASNLTQAGESRSQYAAWIDEIRASTVGNTD